MNKIIASENAQRMLTNVKNYVDAKVASTSSGSGTSSGSSEGGVLAILNSSMFGFKLQ